MAEIKVSLAVRMLIGWVVKRIGCNRFSLQSMYGFCQAEDNSTPCNKDDQGLGPNWLSFFSL